MAAYLETENLRLNQAEGLAVDLDQASAGLFQKFRQHFCTSHFGQLRSSLSARIDPTKSRIFDMNNFDVLDHGVSSLSSLTRVLRRDLGVLITNLAVRTEKLWVSLSAFRLGDGSTNTAVAVFFLPKH